MIRKYTKIHIHLFHILITYYHSDNMDKILRVAYQNVAKKICKSICHLFFFHHYIKE